MRDQHRGKSYKAQQKLFRWVNLPPPQGVVDPQFGKDWSKSSTLHFERFPAEKEIGPSRQVDGNSRSLTVAAFVRRVDDEHRHGAVVGVRRQRRAGHQQPAPASVDDVVGHRFPRRRHLVADVGLPQAAAAQLDVDVDVVGVDGRLFGAVALRSAALRRQSQSRISEAKKKNRNEIEDFAKSATLFLLLYYVLLGDGLRFNVRATFVAGKPKKIENLQNFEVVRFTSLKIKYEASRWSIKW